METIKYLLNWAEIVIITHNGPKLLISLKLYFLDKIDNYFSFVSWQPNFNFKLVYRLEIKLNFVSRSQL